MRHSAARPLPADRDHVIQPRSLARVLGVQYVVGGLLGIHWVTAWYGDGWIREVASALGVLALCLGTGLTLLASTRVSTAMLTRASHACILSAQVVVVLGYAVTQDPGSPLLMFLLWTTPYAGLFAPRPRWLHVLTPLVLLAGATLTMPDKGRAVVELVLVAATIVVVTLLVSRITGLLHTAATQDPLTGLPNRRLFHSATRGALARRATQGGHVTVLLIDLDRFKNINDSYGHAAGDELLSQLAPRLQAAVGPQGLIARLGGDEFAVLHEDPSPVASALLLGRLHRTWSDPVLIEGRRLYVGASVGVASATDDATPETLLRDADTAMYEAKGAGGARWHVFDPRWARRSQRLVAVELGLREAVVRGELALHYQPVMALDGGAPLGAEGLMRWTSAELGAVQPDEFIGVAETTGLIEGLGRWALDRALGDLAAWRRAGAVDDRFQIAVNVSAHQLTEALPAEVAALLLRHGVPGSNLALEVTESAMMTGETPGTVLEQLHALGVVLMLDDFGTGHSSLSHLRRFPLDVVKIDRSFVGGMCTDPADRALVLGVLSLARALGKTVVAEGIEDDDQLRDLWAAGCHAGQGYHLSRPVPAGDLLAALQSARRSWSTVPQPRLAR